jgi:hypothetical protein
MGDSQVKHRGFVLAIMDNIFVAPRHYVETWRAALEDDPEYRVHFRRLGDMVDHQVIKVRATDLLESQMNPRGNEDMVAFYIGTNVLPRFPSIKRYLCSEKEIRTRGTITLPRVDFHDLSIKYESAPFMSSGSIRYGNGYEIETPITYRISTQRGDCGLPVAVNDPYTMCRKICGFHVAGTVQGSTAIAINFQQRDFEDIVGYYSKRYNLVESQYRTDSRTIGDLNNKGLGFNELYSVPLDIAVPGKVNLGVLDAPRIPSATRIVPSPLFKKIDGEVKTKPARLRPFVNKAGERVDPLAISASKYHRTVEYLDPDILDVCKNDLTDCLLNDPLARVHPDVGRRVLSFKEAVEGIPGVEGLSGIPRKTSAGYPHCLETELRGKRDFFGTEGSYEFDSDKAHEIEARVDQIIASASEGKREIHVFLDFPKDERRPKDKVEIGKTRNISACPVDYAIACRMYFGAFIQYFMYNRIHNEAAIGVNVYSSEWDDMTRFLGSDRRAIAGDHGTYDGFIPYSVMVRMLDSITDFYQDRGSVNERIRLVLFQELVNSRHINHNGTIYEWVGSNASGNPLTAVLNSWCNLLLLRYACARAVGEITPNGVRAFLRERRQFMRFMVYGDDNLITICKYWERGKYITQDSLTEVFRTMGFDYTDETKGACNVGNDRTLEEVTFLKRGFEPNSIVASRKYLAPLSLDTIKESIQWTKKEDFDYDYVKDNVVNMLQELSMHKKEVFDELAPRIVKACVTEMKFIPVPNSYDDCQRVILSRETKW